jgi:hypothetical protein
MGIASAQEKVPPDNIVKANITLKAQAAAGLVKDYFSLIPGPLRGLLGGLVMCF